MQWPISGDKCEDCDFYIADEVNPKAGLGDCPQEKPDVLMPHWEHGEFKWVYQKKLSYPGSEACGKFRQTSKSDSDS